MIDPERIDDLRRRVHEDPASIAFAQLAEEYRRTGRHQEAVDTCRSGLTLHPEYVSARVTLGRALLALDRPGEALAELGIVLAAAPENLAALRAMGEACRRQGRTADALTHVSAALGLAPNDPDLERSLTDLRATLEHERRDPAAASRARTGRTLAALERWLEAIHAARTD